MQDLKKVCPWAGVMTLGAVLWASPGWAQNAAPDLLALDRPEPTAIGMGFGTRIDGSSLIEPDTASVRFALTEDLQLEPLVVLTLSGTPNAAGDTDTTVRLSAGTLVRYLLDSRGPVDFQLLGGALVDHLAPEGSSTTEVSVSWGASVVWYITPRWAASLDALNPVLSLARTSPDVGDATTTWTFGATWNPSLALMVHMFF